MTGYDDSPEIDASFRMTTPSRDVIWGVVASLGILALVGAFVGFQNVRTGDIMPTGWVPGSAPAANITGASPAVAMPKDEKWSTLNGPQIAEPPAPKPAKAAHKDDDDAADAAAPMPDPNAAGAPPVTDAAPIGPDPKGASQDAPPGPQPQ